MKEMMKMMKSDSGDMGKEAKLKVLKELKRMASEMMGGDVKDGMMKKVTVASPDKEGLKLGLEKAKEMIAKHPMEEDSDKEMKMESPEEADEDVDMEDMYMGSEEDMGMDMEKCTPEQIDEKIAKLQEMKKKMQMKY